MHTTFVIWDDNLSSDGLYLLKREGSPKLCLLKNKSSGVPQPVVFPEAWLPLWPRSLYWLTVKRGCVIQFYLSKSPILSGQKHYFSIRIVFIYDKRPFSSHSWVWCPSFLGAILLFSVLQYLAIHPQNWHSLLKRELLEQRRKWVLARGVKFERSYTWWWCWWCLASATPTPDLRFPHIWKLHVTKFELQAAKTIWRKLERAQVSILLLRSK